jgi:hypothetical protein
LQNGNFFKLNKLNSYNLIKVEIFKKKEYLMKNKIILPSFLYPYKIEDLTRIGNPNDGGYIVSNQDILDSEYLISLGISFDY